MRRTTLAALAVLAAVIAAPASGDVYSRKHSVDARLSTLHARIAATQQRAQQLSAQIESVNSRIHSLEGRVGDVSVRLATLENDLGLHRRKLDQLVSSRQELVSARSTERVSLGKVRASEREAVGEAQALEQVSASLGAQIQAAQSASSYSPPASRPSSGFIWPVNGPVTSPFGMRWGRMHTGIDIGVAYGTPIHAAASGQVIYAGWMDGYGNLVFVDHGRGLSTGYAHQSSIAVSNGQAVTQGQVIGYVGCTGHCFGPHLHFEVRVNGTPVDPLGYL